MSHPNTDALFDHVRSANADVAAHAASCSACKAELAELSALVHGARAIEPEPASTYDDDVAIALALEEAPAEQPRARWPYGLAVAAAALLAVGAWFAQVQPSVLTVQAVDATTGALVAEVAPGSVVSFQVPVRVVLGEGISVELDALSTFAVLDMNAPDVLVRLDSGTLHWTLLGPPNHSLTVTTAGSPIVVHDGTGQVSATTASEVPPKPTPRPARRRAAAASDLLVPTPDVQIEPMPLEPNVAEPPEEPVPASPVPAAPGPEALYKAAELAMADGDTANALVLLDELAARWPDHPSGHLALFDRARLIERTDPTHAAAAWRRYLDLGPGEPLYDVAEARLCRVDPPTCR